MPRYIAFGAVLMAVAVGGYVFASYSSPDQHFKRTSDGYLCPDSYQTDDEATGAMNAWTTAYFDNHPNATIAEWGEARRQFYIDHNCTAALQREEMVKNGTADKATMDRIDSVLQKYKK